MRQTKFPGYLSISCDYDSVIRPPSIKLTETLHLLICLLFLVYLSHFGIFWPLNMNSYKIETSYGFFTCPLKCFKLCMAIVLIILTNSLRDFDFSCIALFFQLTLLIFTISYCFFVHVHGEFIECHSRYLYLLFVF